MPFTAAHPAAVVPLLRRGWPVDRAALVCGAMAPDFEYFVRARLESSFSHTLPGLLFTLPMAALLVLIWELVLRGPVLATLPPTLRARTRTEPPPGLTRDARAWTLLVSCALLGVLTHLGWDAFTHHEAPGVLLLPVLETPVRLGPVEWPAYRCVQHGSTLVGALVLAWHVRQLPLRADQGPPDRILRRRLLVGTCIGGLALPWLRHGLPSSSGELWTMRGNLIVAGLAGSMLGLLLAASTAPVGRSTGH